MAVLSPSAKFGVRAPEITHLKLSENHFTRLHCRSPSKRQFSFSKSLSSSSPFSFKPPIFTSRSHGNQSVSSSLRCFEVDAGSPWEGAVVYKRDPSVTHLEYYTTLERLGLDKLSSEVSKSRASLLGLRVTRAVKNFQRGTPVQISMDVSRRKKKLRLDGIVKTVITLGCNRCAEPTGESVFSNFTLLLREEPIEEPETIYLFGEDKISRSNAGDEEDEDDDMIDWDDQLYFPVEENEIDISKHIRDLVHVEITINAICDPKCKGLCLNCGVNFNKASCNCGKQQVRQKNEILTET